MILVLDKDACFYVFESVDAAQRELEVIDIENDEYEFCDELGQPYAGELLPSHGTLSGGGFRIVPRRPPNAALPLSFVGRARHFCPKGTPFKTLDDARAYFSRTGA